MTDRRYARCVLEHGGRASFHERSDPNGIRTRVTAVKGRCPGPLDDRVIKLGNIGIAMVGRKANWQMNLECADMSRRFEKRSPGRGLPHCERYVALSVSVRAREPAWLSARSRPDARSKQRVRFARDAGAPRCRAEDCQQRARASRRRRSGSLRYLKPAF